MRFHVLSFFVALITCGFTPTFAMPEPKGGGGMDSVSSGGYRNGSSGDYHGGYKRDPEAPPDGPSDPWAGSYPGGFGVGVNGYKTEVPKSSVNKPYNKSIYSLGSQRKYYKDGRNNINNETYCDFHFEQNDKNETIKKEYCHRYNGVAKNRISIGASMGVAGLLVWMFL